MLWARALALCAAALCAACQLKIDPYEDRACDATHPCLAGSGRECVRNLCQLPWDGGTQPLPEPATTGAIPGTALTPSSSLRITQAGRVVEGLDVTGCVVVVADNVVLRNLRIRTDGVCTDSLLDVRGAKGTLVEDVEIDGTGHGKLYAIWAGSELTLRRVHVHDAWSGMRVWGDGVTLEHSLLHAFTATDSAGAFVTAGGARFTVRHNALEISGPGDGVVVLYAQTDAISDVLAEANLINGGGWSVIAGGGTAALPSQNVRFLRNRFGRKFHARCGSYGPVTSFEAKAGNVWQDNVWDDTGEPVEP